jgi:hypothetical protein
MDKLTCLRDYTDKKDVVSLFEEVTDETGNKRKQLFIKGPFLQGDITNRNGRVYPVPMLEKAVSLFMKEKVRGVGVPGELNHPQSSIQIDLDRVSHYITDLKMEGKNGMGKAKIASTPKGQIAACMINDGLILGVSTRGIGKLSEGSNDAKIVTDFELVTVDIVSDPSAPNAFVEAVMEGLQYYVDSETKDIKLATTVEEMLESIKNNLKVLPKKSEAKKTKLFDTINNILSKI